MANAETQGRQIGVPADSERMKRWARVVVQARADDNFKQRLIASPAAVLGECGIEIPAGVEIRLVENTSKVVHLTLPAKPLADVSELTPAQLESVVGGYCCCSFCIYNPTYPSPIPTPYPNI